MLPNTRTSRPRVSSSSGLVNQGTPTPSNKDPPHLHICFACNSAFCNKLILSRHKKQGCERMAEWNARFATQARLDQAWRESSRTKWQDCWLVFKHNDSITVTLTLPLRCDGALTLADM